MYFIMPLRDSIALSVVSTVLPCVWLCQSYISFPSYYVAAIDMIET